jgi:hypothetical protein
MVQVYGNNTIISLTPIHFPYTKASASVKYALSEASIAASNEHRNPLRKMGRAPVAKSAMFSLISPSLASIFVERRVVVSRWREGAAKEIFFLGAVGRCGSVQPISPMRDGDLLEAALYTSFLLYLPLDVIQIIFN